MSLLVLPSESVCENESTLRIAKTGPRVGLRVISALFFYPACDLSPLGDTSTHVKLSTVVPCGNVDLGEITVSGDLDV